MARTPREITAPPPPPPSVMVAAAKKMAVADVSNTRKMPTSKSWQDRAWYYYDTIGEFAFAANWVGNLLSRAVLYATYDDGSGPVRVKQGDPADLILDELFDDRAGRSQMLKDIGVAYTVAGECWIIGYDDEEDDERTIWEVVSPQDLTKTAGVWKLYGEEVPGEPLVIRLWRPHPRKRKQATSPTRAALPILQEIEYITQRINAEITSRLAGAGIYWIPNQIAAATATVHGLDGTTQQVTAEQFVRLLQDTMATAIADRGDAAAMVPIVVTADAEFIEKVKHDTFWSEMDDQLLGLREAATKRLALSLDMPPEVLTGVGEANHWSAWQVDESAIKAHSEPLLYSISNDLAAGYLRTTMRTDGVDPAEVRKYGIGADTSEMRLRPNRGKEALELNDRGILSDLATARETGFGVEDMMKPEEKAQWILQKMASGSATPEMVVEAARLLGANLPQPVVEDEPNEARPAPSLVEHPVREIPEENAVSDALIAASEVLVFRALERAGNRLRTKTGAKMTDVAASEVYMFVPCAGGTINDVLEDAWSNVDRFAPRLGVDAGRLAASLDSYCRVLISERKPHDPGLLATYLTLTRTPA